MSTIEKLNKKVRTASKWSAITEIATRFIAPISSMILARLLTPDAFGIVATITMIISFAELFTDAGFHKYLIQHEFKDDVDRDESTNVAFWSNLTMSIFLWILIAFFREDLAGLVGNPGLGYVVTIACVAIPLGAFSSIQMALFKRDFDFKTLFKVRMVGTFMPILVTVPLAFWTRNYWALIIGTIAKDVINAFLLTIYSRWKPRFYYSYEKLKEMLSFTIWSIFEKISIWLTNYFDIFIIGSVLSQYYLGLYKTSTWLVGVIIGLITSATTPILFSSLSRLQSEEEEFKTLFLRFQRVVAFFVFPVACIIFCYSDLLTYLVLGKQWMEASNFIGLWALMSAVTIVLSHYSSEVYRAKGRPKFSVLAQWLHIIALWPTILISVNYGFEILYISRTLIRIELIIVNLFLMYYLVHFSPLQMILNVIKPAIASFVIIVISFLMRDVFDCLLWQLFVISLCLVTYIIILMSNAKDKVMILSLIKKK